ncbi:hypothetical protein MKW94_011180 [Papaver nudicaule]|uniref:Uncharacterized protein n=1 Tax=Papaver nudicaule TaxID=74823 RepID=A0AA41UY83_PAPNU|nr:hypothetical protein [Papaver nudicaule]
MIRENGEFIIESVDGVSSWLIWIHFLVMLLLMIILVYLTVISVSDSSSSSSPPSPSSFGVGQISVNKKKYNRNNSTTSCSSPEEDIKVNEDHRENQSTSTRRGIIRSGNPVAQVNAVEALSTPAATTTTSTAYCSSYNPCYLLELGRRAFLKCLGLDDTPTTSQDSSLPNGNNGQGKLTKTDKSQ